MMTSLAPYWPVSATLTSVMTDSTTPPLSAPTRRSPGARTGARRPRGVKSGTKRYPGVRGGAGAPGCVPLALIWLEATVTFSPRIDWAGSEPRNSVRAGGLSSSVWRRRGRENHWLIISISLPGISLDKTSDTAVLKVSYDEMYFASLN